jgi:hypothetical protein
VKSESGGNIPLKLDYIIWLKDLGDSVEISSTDEKLAKIYFHHHSPGTMEIAGLFVFLEKSGTVQIDIHGDRAAFQLAIEIVVDHSSERNEYLISIHSIKQVSQAETNR